MKRVKDTFKDLIIQAQYKKHIFVLVPILAIVWWLSALIEAKIINKDLYENKTLINDEQADKNSQLMTKFSQLALKNTIILPGSFIVAASVGLIVLVYHDRCYGWKKGLGISLLILIKDVLQIEVLQSCGPSITLYLILLIAQFLAQCLTFIDRKLIVIAIIYTQLLMLCVSAQLLFDSKMYFSGSILFVVLAATPTYLLVRKQRQLIYQQEEQGLEQDSNVQQAYELRFEILSVLKKKFLVLEKSSQIAYISKDLQQTLQKINCSVEDLTVRKPRDHQQNISFLEYVREQQQKRIQGRSQGTREISYERAEVSISDQVYRLISVKYGEQRIIIMSNDEQNTFDSIMRSSRHASKGHQFQYMVSNLDKLVHFSRKVISYLADSIHFQDALLSSGTVPRAQRERLSRSLATCRLLENSARNVLFFVHSTSDEPSMRQSQLPANQNQQIQLQQNGICLSPPLRLQQQQRQQNQAQMIARNSFEGGECFKIHPFNLQLLIQSCLETVRKLIINRQLYLLDSIEESCTIVNSDAEKLRQLLLNLLENAVQNSQKGSIRVVATKNSAPNGVNITVEDEGIGITTEQKRAIFQARRAHVSLFVCSQLAALLADDFSSPTKKSLPQNQQEDQLYLDNECEKGSKFSFFVRDFTAKDYKNLLRQESQQAQGAQLQAYQDISPSQAKNLQQEQRKRGSKKVLHCGKFPAYFVESRLEMADEALMPPSLQQIVCIIHEKSPKQRQKIGRQEKRGSLVQEGGGPRGSTAKNINLDVSDRIYQLKRNFQDEVQNFAGGPRSPQNGSNHKNSNNLAFGRLDESQQQMIMHSENSYIIQQQSEAEGDQSCKNTKQRALQLSKRSSRLTRNRPSFVDQSSVRSLQQLHHCVCEHVLVVDKDELALESVKDYLWNQLHIRCALATSAEAALTQITEKLSHPCCQHFGLVVTETTLPDSTGAELVQDIRSLYEKKSTALNFTKCPVLAAHSSDFAQETIDQFMLAGVRFFIEKPFQAGDFEFLARKFNVYEGSGFEFAVVPPFGSNYTPPEKDLETRLHDVQFQLTQAQQRAQALTKQLAVLTRYLQSTGTPEQCTLALTLSAHYYITTFTAAQQVIVGDQQKVDLKVKLLLDNSNGGGNGNSNMFDSKENGYALPCVQLSARVIAQKKEVTYTELLTLAELQKILHLVSYQRALPSTMPLQSFSDLSSFTRHLILPFIDVDVPGKKLVVQSEPRRVDATKFTVHFLGEDCELSVQHIERHTYRLSLVRVEGSNNQATTENTQQTPALCVDLEFSENASERPKYFYHTYGTGQDPNSAIIQQQSPAQTTNQSAHNGFFGNSFVKEDEQQLFRKSNPLYPDRPNRLQQQSSSGSIPRYDSKLEQEDEISEDLFPQHTGFRTTNESQERIRAQRILQITEPVPEQAGVENRFPRRRLNQTECDLLRRDILHNSDTDAFFECVHVIDLKGAREFLKLRIEYLEQFILEVLGLNASFEQHAQILSNGLFVIQVINVKNCITKCVYETPHQIDLYSDNLYNSHSTTIRICIRNDHQIGNNSSNRQVAFGAHILTEEQFTKLFGLRYAALADEQQKRALLALVLEAYFVTGDDLQQGGMRKTVSLSRSGTLGPASSVAAQALAVQNTLTKRELVSIAYAREIVLVEDTALPLTIQLFSFGRDLVGIKCTVYSVERIAEEDENGALFFTIAKGAWNVQDEDPVTLLHKSTIHGPKESETDFSNNLILLLFHDVIVPLLKKRIVIKKKGDILSVQIENCLGLLLNSSKVMRLESILSVEQLVMRCD